MSARDLMHEAQRQGVQVFLKDGLLKIHGSEEAAHQWAERLRPHKAALIALLQHQAEQPPANWGAVRDAYYSHHRQCPTCICAGRGYGLRCGAGAALWAAYVAVPPPFAKQ